MTDFTRQWNSAYEGIPDDSENARQGAQRIREFKTDIAQRLAVNHMLNGDEQDGKHSKVTLRVLATDPSIEGTNQEGILYAKLQGGVVQLYYRSSAGIVYPMTSTSGGQANIVQTGTIIAVGNAVDADGVTYVQCDGRAISRVNYTALFGAIGTLWGIGDGSTTFNVPELRGRTVIGRGTGPGLGARATGQLGGEESHALTIPEMPAHTHTVNIKGGAATAGIAGAMGSSAIDNSFTTSSVGNSNAHNNMQPFGVINWWIKT